MEAADAGAESCGEGEEGSGERAGRRGGEAESCGRARVEEAAARQERGSGESITVRCNFKSCSGIWRIVEKVRKVLMRELTGEAARLRATAVPLPRGNYCGEPFSREL